MATGFVDNNAGPSQGQADYGCAEGECFKAGLAEDLLGCRLEEGTGAECV